MGGRRLEAHEIAALERQGCSAERWDRVRVAPGFDTARVRSVSFTGEVTLGSFRAQATLPDGVGMPTGLYDCRLHDTSVGEDALLWRVHRVSACDIGARAVVANVDSVVTSGESAFGNGTELEILNEGGGRTLVIYDRLSAPVAYLMVLYRHRPDLVDGLAKAIGTAVAERKARRGSIGEASSVVDCGEIRNVRIGPVARIHGASLLEEGTVASSAASPVRIGRDVSARHFIVLGDSVVDGAAMLDRCFVGQGVRIGRQLSAENSAFFANTEAFHGEMVSVLAGPYTVSHHKSTLLIAGLYSFFNAGSGTNQSNHMYKLGPLQQGVLERGCKTGSFAYLLWPSRVGCFTAVMGAHHGSFDTTDLPFSYLTETGGKSTLTPAMNLLTVGTRRDSEKWRKRDRRAGPDRLDPVSFELLNPYVVGRVQRGHRTVSRLYAESPKTQELVSYKGVQIQRLMLRTAARYYEMAVDVFMGRCLLERLESSPAATRAVLGAGIEGAEDWVDLAGLVAPKNAVQRLVDGIASGKLPSVERIEEALGGIHAGYGELEWAFCARLCRERLGKPPAELGREELRSIVERWRDASVKWNNMILADAVKEFDESARIGFGIDGEQEERRRDFEAVRGSYDGNSFVKGLRDETQAIPARAERALQAIAALGDR
jgi:hypothetical protein